MVLTGEYFHYGGKFIVCNSAWWIVLKKKKTKGKKQDSYKWAKAPN